MHDRKALDWPAEADALFDLLYPLVVDAGIDGAVSGMSFAPLAELEIDFALVNEAVREWARQYTFDLVTAITDTSRTFLQETISAWTASGEPLSALVEQLTPMFGPVRAEMISVTEITRAYAQGNIEAWRTVGVIEQMQWNTANDALVCPICAPLNGRADALDGHFDAGGPPPAHVRCRCWLSPVMELEKSEARGKSRSAFMTKWPYLLEIDG